jgi:hypothetical protein
LGFIEMSGSFGGSAVVLDFGGWKVLCTVAGKFVYVAFAFDKQFAVVKNLNFQSPLSCQGKTK